jgi:ABC-type transport system substrate-binding protein
VWPEEATRLAALKRGEVDIAYSIRGELAEEVQKTPGLTLKPVVTQATFWLYFPDQWDAKSPWHDPRVREAARLAIDGKSISEALTLGYSPVTNSIIPDGFDFYWKAPAAVYDLAKAKQLLAEAGFRNGFDAGDYSCDASYANLAEAAINNLQEVGIRVKLRPLERAAFFAPTPKAAEEPHPGLPAFGNARRPGGVRGQGRRLRLWQPSRDRRAVCRAGGASSTRQAHRDAAPGAADRA